VKKEETMREIADQPRQTNKKKETMLKRLRARTVRETSRKGGTGAGRLARRTRMKVVQPEGIALPAKGGEGKGLSRWLLRPGKP